MTLHGEPIGGAGDLVGPYRCTALLGEGGMGIVYRGEHLHTREPAAVKTVRAANAATLDAIRREIRALGRVQHPGIVRILGEGVHRGLPWYAMELVEGRTLRALLHERLRKGTPADPTVVMETFEVRSPSSAGGLAPPDVRAPAPPFEAALAVLHDLCDALAHLHAAGLVHRDLKPENVIVRPTGAPVLMDLGIAAPFGGAAGREEIAVDLKVLGSFAYMAPEQIRGEPTDARADLYALGCILYEALTGRPPFLVGPDMSVLSAHLRGRPLYPSELVFGVPEPLDALAMRLLAKEPRERPGYAADVAAALRPFVPPDRAAAPRAPAPAYVYRPQMTGRRAALTRLDDAVRALAAGEGGLVFVGGESGAGKTRLVSEAARAAVRRDVLVVSGHTTARLSADRAVPGGVPFEPARPLLAAIADRTRAADPAEMARVFRGRAGLLAPYEPAVEEVAARLDEPPPPSLPPAAAKARVLQALADTVTAFAETAPLLWIADDLQWADELTLAFLQWLAAREQRGWLAVGTFRSDELTHELALLITAPRVARIDLDRFGRDDIRDMVSGMLAIDRPPDALVDFLTEASSGNPFFLGEYLRVAIDEGLLARGPSGSFFLDERAAGRIASRVPLPRSLAALLERRLASLDADALRAAEAASVLGREVPAAWLEAVSGLHRDALLDAVQSLRVHHVLEDAEPGKHRFVHDKLRESAYSRIPLAERPHLHLRAAETIEAHAKDAPEHTAALAHHLAHGGRPARAAAAYEQAGGRARAAHANEEAITLYRAALAQAERALASGDGEPDALHAAVPRVSELLGDVLGVAGKHDEARAAYEAALPPAARAPAPPPPALPREAALAAARLHRKIATTFETSHRHHGALVACDSGDALLAPLLEPPADDEAALHEHIWIQVERIGAFYWLSDVDAIARIIAAVTPAMDRVRDPELRSAFFHALTQCGLRQERFRPGAATVGHARASLAHAERGGHPLSIAERRFTLGFVLLFHGALEEAQALLQKALSEAEQLGYAQLVLRCLTYTAVVARRLGRAADVERIAARALALAADLGAVDYRATAEANLAWTALREGDRAAALGRGRKALSLWQSGNFMFAHQWLALCPLLSLAIARGDRAAAAAHAKAMLAPSHMRWPDETHAVLTALSTGDLDSLAPALLPHLEQLCRM